MLRSSVPGRTELRRTAPLLEERRRRAFAIALILALAACGSLAWIVLSTRWTMDADESVHAVEALRLYEDLGHGDLGAFLADSYFPERWQPPVDDHVRWYPFVHAWLLQPFFALLGPSDASARVASVAFLLGTALVFFALAWRLARVHKAASGVLAVVLLLAAPNVLTFSAQCLIEPAVLFTCSAALLLYLRSLEKEHPPLRASLAGLALGLAALTKYDHGGFLALALAAAELLRVRFSLVRLVRSGAALLFGITGILVVLWFAHPDKLAALRDSAEHPFYGSPRTILMDFALTWVIEYGSSVAVGLLAILAFVALRTRLREPALRAVWIWALVSCAFYAVRGRYHFRYNFVEAPIFLLLLAVALPEWIERWSARLAGARPREATGTLLGLWVFGAAGAWAWLLVAVGPEALFEALRAPLAWFHGLRADHWGLTLAPDRYIDELARDYLAFARWLALSLAACCAALFVVGAAGLAWRHVPAGPGSTRRLLWAAIGVAALPGAVQLHAGLRTSVEWELECHPALNEVYAFVSANVEPGQTILLGGGWDQLPNNSLRWYLATRGRGEGRSLENQPVVGDMIGSVVFPPEPRIAYWAGLLSGAPHAGLPERVVLVEPDEQSFRYQCRFGDDAGLYEKLLASRSSHAEIARRSFAELGCTVRVLARAEQSEAPLSPESRVNLVHELSTNPAFAWGQRRVGLDGGWIMRDESLRHFVRR